MTCSAVDDEKHHRVAVVRRETAAGVLEVKRQAFLRPVAAHEVRSHADDTRADIGELARAEGPGDGLLKGDDGDSVERSHHGEPQAGCESRRSGARAQRRSNSRTGSKPMRRQNSMKSNIGMAGVWLNPSVVSMRKAASIDAAATSLVIEG